MSLCGIQARWRNYWCSDFIILQHNASHQSIYSRLMTWLRASTGPSAHIIPSRLCTETGASSGTPWTLSLLHQWEYLLPIVSSMFEFSPSILLIPLLSSPHNIHLIHIHLVKVLEQKLSISIRAWKQRHVCWLIFLRDIPMFQLMTWAAQQIQIILIQEIGVLHVMEWWFLWQSVA